MKKASILLLVLVLFIPNSVQAGEESPQWEKLYYRDNDGDGINDLFRDADGDGINDMTGRQYRHRFTFSDTDGDGINDVFRDANGDGINDLAENAQGKKEEITHTVIDFDEDGINDVTGRRYRPRKRDQKFIDENGDGINDNITVRDTQTPSGRGHGMGMDRFVDEDGDGINDGRGFFKGLREKQRRESDRGMERRSNR